MLQDFITKADKAGLELYGVAVMQNGRKLAGHQWAPDEPRELYSLSKSFVCCALGMLIAQGKLKLGDPVVSFFPPERLPDEITPDVRAMTVRDLLTMATGHGEAYLLSPQRAKVKEQGITNWVKYFLSQPMAYAPGSYFLYDSGCTYIISAIIQEITGMKTRDYLVPCLFEPMGMGVPEWTECPDGYTFGGAGLKLRTGDILRFGQMLLQNGMWEGRQLVPSEWLKEATSFQIDPSVTQSNKDSSRGYGYQFWLNSVGGYRGDGSFGQFAIVLPELDAVIATTGNHQENQQTLDLIWSEILPKLS